MNRIKFLILVVMATSCINCSSEEIKIEFSEKGNLPSKIIFNEEYFEQTNNLFFIMANYGENKAKLVEYSLDKREVVSVIKEIDPENSNIQEFDNSGNYITFSVVKFSNELEKEIYYYDIIKKELLKIENYVITGYPKNYSIRLNISNNKIVWVEYDFSNKISYLKLFNIDKKEIKIIDFEKFTATGYIYSIFFAEFKDGLIFYDKSRDNQPLKIYCYDTSTETIIEEYTIPEGVKLHYNGSYNSSKNYLALYARNQKEEIIYKIDLNNKEFQLLAGINKHSWIYHDILETNDNQIFYNIEVNLSGTVKDNHYAEVYDLNSYKIKQIKTAFHIIKSENYLGLLKFDEKLHHNKIHFELKKMETLDKY